MVTRFDAVSPLDYRYYGGDKAFFARLQPFVSEQAWIRYQSRVEAALVETFADVGLCPASIAEEIVRACQSVSAEDVYSKEASVEHASRALVECIRTNVSDEARRFVHLFATSFDIIDTATALRLQDVCREVLLPDLIGLVRLLIELAGKHEKTLQIGRTHGMHAEPITFGLFLSVYVSRLANRAIYVERARQNLRGKLSGAVGAHNALSLAFSNSAHLVERLFLARLGLLPSETYTSTQIVEPEYVADLAHSIVSCFSVLANLADDIRHLHRSEIAEVQEPRGKRAVGSSTMPHKTNPKSFENIKSLYKAFMPRIITFYLDQISEHQRDLTNSASGRFTMELVVAFDYAVLRMQKALRSLVVDAERMRANLDSSKGYITAEPLYILLSLAGVENAYEVASQIADDAVRQGRTVAQIALEDARLKEAIDALGSEAVRILDDPTRYIGDATARVKATCTVYEAKMRDLLDYLQKEGQVVKSPPERFIKELAEAVKTAETKEEPPQQTIPQTRREMIEAWLRVQRAKQGPQRDR